MTTSGEIAKLAKELHSVPADIYMSLAQFLYYEARLLDEEKYRAWLGLMDPAIDYWVPGIQSRYRTDKAAPFTKTRMSHFQENFQDLDLRIKRLESPMAWAEDPPTRFCHSVSNIEVEPTAMADVFLVRSILTLHRNRNETESTQLVSRREDHIRLTDDGWRVLRRTVFILQSVLLHKNLNSFL